MQPGWEAGATLSFDEQRERVSVTPLALRDEETESLREDLAKLALAE